MNLDAMISETIAELENIPSESYGGILISKNWGCIKSLQWMVENARFIFSYHGAGRERIDIVTRETIEGYDQFEIGNDRYGITENGCARFNNTWGEQIRDSSKDIIPFIKEYLVRIKATHLIIK